MFLCVQCSDSVLTVNAATLKLKALCVTAPKKAELKCVCVCVCVLVMSLEELLKTSVGVRPLLQFYLSVQKCN